MANPNEAGGWVVDPTNPNRATYTDEDGQTYEAFKPDTPDNRLADIPLASGPQAEAVEGKNHYQESIDRMGGWGIAPETRRFLGAEDNPDTYLKEVINPLNNAVADTADLAFRGLQAGQVVAEGTAGYVDDVFDYTGLADLPSVVGVGNKLHPGEALMALAEAFPMLGAEAGVMPKLKLPELEPTLRPNPLEAQRQAWAGEEALQSAARQLFENPASTRADFDALAAQHGRSAWGSELDDALANRDRTTEFVSSMVENVAEYEAQAKAANQARGNQLFRARVENPDVPKSVDSAVEHLTNLTTDWSNPPRIEVVDDIANLADAGLRDSLDPSMVGAVLPDGSVLINMKNVAEEANARGITQEDMLSAVTYHEALGHYGLTQKFGDELDAILANLYYDSKGFKERVDRWMDENPDAYSDAPDPLLRATEEVLAEMSEAGQIPVSLMDQFKNWMKTQGRDLGISLKYSDREVKAILGMAHDSVVRGGSRDVVGNGFRYARVYHGSPYEFDEFDHSKMGSGEGAQVYGWGTYLTETKGIAEGYKETLSRNKSTASYKGREFEPTMLNMIQFGAQLRRDLRESGKVAADDIKGNRMVDQILHTIEEEGRLPSSEEAFNNSFSRGVSKPFFGRDKYRKAAQSVIEHLEAEGFKYDKKTGKFYEVDIPDEGWVLWDKPVSEQPKLVEALKNNDLEIISAEDIVRLREETDIAREAMGEARRARHAAKTRAERDELTEAYEHTQDVYDSLYSRLSGALTSDKTAGETINELGWRMGDREISLMLNKEGFVGNKYLDGMSRRKGEGSYNYVVFNEKDAKIVNRYMRRSVGKGSDALPEGRTARQARDEDKPQTVGGYRSRENISDILDENAPTPTKESWNDWIEGVNDVRQAVKNAKNLKSGATPSEVLSARESIVKSANRIAQLSRKAVDGNLTPREEYLLQAEMARNAAMQEALQGVRSNAARIVNSFKIDVDTDQALADAIRNMMKTTGNQVFSNPKNFQQLTQQIAQLQSNPQAVQKLVQAATKPRAEDYIFRVWYNMMLSSPATHVANLAGTLGNFGADLLENTGAAVIGQRGRMKNADRVRMREVYYRVYGAIKALQDSQTWKNTLKSYDTGETGNVVNTKTGGSQVYTGNNKAGKAASYVLEGPTRALAAEDEWWRSILSLSNIHGLAVRNAGNKGLKGSAFWAEVDNLVNNPTKEMIDASNDYTKTLQFLDKPSRVARGLNKLTSTDDKTSLGGRVGASALKFVIPFVNTPDALIRTALRRTPLGAIERENVKGWKAGGAERDKVVARMVMGSLFSTWIASLAADGLITGQGPSDPRKRQEWAASHQENSIKIGNGWYSIAGLEPVSTNVTGVATLVERSKAGEIDITPSSVGEAAESIYTATTGLGKVLVDNSYLQGLTDLFSMLEGDKTAGANLVGGIASNLTTPAFVRKGVQAADPAIRDTSGDGSFSARIEGRVKSGAPGLSDSLPQRYDVYGRPMSRDFVGPDIASRMNRRSEETDPVIRELQRLGDNSPDGVVVGAPGKNVKVGGEQRRLNSDEFQDYQRLSGYWIVESVRQEMQSPDWDNMSEADKIGVVKEIVRDMRKTARETLFPGDEE